MEHQFGCGRGRAEYGSEVLCGLSELDGRAGEQRKQAGELSKLVHGVCVLCMGRGAAGNRGGVELRGLGG